eukprot:TRINITY_DN5228_c0_g1_i2.p1 TRINITY_DN5228_c0_g1~~TRINITY_DN5228_c0_g1_i2.p1  ORF type:complete len:2448 (+),score=396.61 TRINITY_DN5228_c0_g1_i2:69-7412(+)
MGGRKSGPSQDWVGAVERACVRIDGEDGERAIRELKRLIEAQAMSVAPEEIRPYQRVVNLQLQNLAKSKTSSTAKCACIRTISALIDVDYTDSSSRTAQLSFFANFLSSLLCTEDTTQADLAASTLGRVVKTDSLLMYEVFESECNRYLEWLSSNKQSHFYSVAVGFRELISAAPALITTRLGMFKKALWAGLEHSSITVRVAFSSTMRALLQVDSVGEEEQDVDVLNTCIDVIESCSQPTKVLSCKESYQVHGALLALGELTEEQGLPKEGIYDFACSKALILAAAPHCTYVRVAAVNLLCVLASYCSVEFQRHATAAIDVCIALAKSSSGGSSSSANNLSLLLIPRGEPDDVRQRTFTALASLIPLTSVSSTDGLCEDLINQRELQIGQIKSAVVQALESDPPCPGAAACAAVLMDEEISQILLENASGLPLNASLTKPLLELGKRLAGPGGIRTPSSRTLELSRRLSNSMTFSSRTSRGVSSEHSVKFLKKALHIIIERVEDVLTATHIDPKGEAAMVALTALRDCEPYMRLASNSYDCLMKCILPVLYHDRSVVRKEAAISICLLLNLPDIDSQSSELVLTEALKVGLADPAADVRLAALRSVKKASSYPSCSSLLKLDRVVCFLCSSLVDEQAEARELSLDIVANLVDDSDLVTKRLQSLAKQVTTELQCPTDAVQQEQAARMVGHLARASPGVLMEYDNGLNDMLIDRLSKAANHRFKAAILNTLCYLVESRHAFSSIELSKLQELAVDVIGSQSSPATAPAARLLGHLLRRTKYLKLDVGEPLSLNQKITCKSFAVQHPLVIPRLFECLKENDSDRRTEVLQLLGIIGAIDLSTASHMKKFTEISTKATAADFDAHMAVLKLLSLLEHPSLAFHKRAAVQALQSVLRAIRSMPGARPASLLSRIISTLLRLLQACRVSTHRDPALADALLRTLVHAIALIRTEDNIVASENRLTVISFVKEMIQSMYDFWEVSEQGTVLTIITLAEELHTTLNVMQPHTQWLMPRLIELARGGLCDDALAVRAVQAFETLADLVTPFLIPVTACLLDVAGATDQLPELRIRCLQTLAALSKIGVRMQDVSARIVHALVRISQGVVTPVADARHGVGSVALNTLCIFSAGIGSDFEMFRSSVTRSLRQIEGTEAKEAIETLSNPCSSSPQLTITRYRSQSDPSGRMSPVGLVNQELQTRGSAGFTRIGGHGNNTNHSINIIHLENAFQSCHTAHSEVEFIRWLDTLAQELLTQSPRSVLRACAQIGRGHPPLARSLFPPAFALCYNAVDVKHQVFMTNVIKKVLLTPAANPILRPLLDLCVFVEKTYTQHYADVGELQQPVHKFVPLKRLWALAEDCQDFPLVLHWLETEAFRIEDETCHRPDASFWTESDRTDYLEACRRLVRVNRCLEQQQQAEGILTLIKRKAIADSETAASTYEDLGWWQRAYDQYYNACVTADKANWPFYVAGMMRCREHLGDWTGVLELSETWNTETVRKRTARAVSHAAWMLTEWDKMEEAVSLMPKTGEGTARRLGDSPVGVTAGFYRAILAIKKNNFRFSRNFVVNRRTSSPTDAENTDSSTADPPIDLSELLASCKAGLEKDIIAHVNGTNGRGYELIVMLQHLAEIEEVIEHRESDSLRRSEIESLWFTRLAYMRHDAWHMRDALAVRSLAVGSHDAIHEWLHFVNILEPTRASHVLRGLLDLEPHPTGSLSLPSPASYPQHNPILVLTYFQHLYDAVPHQRHFLIDELQLYSKHLSSQYSAKKTSLNIVRGCLLMSAQWRQILNKDSFWTSPCREEILLVLEQALGMEDSEEDCESSKGDTVDANNGIRYKIFHEWALLNLRIAHRDASLTKSEAAHFAHSAVTGFVKCIEVCYPPERATQDILRLLRLLFTFGNTGHVASEIRNSFKILTSEYWVSVIPQIVARIGEKDPAISSVIRDLLLKIASHFPQRVLLSVSVPLRGSPSDLSEIYLSSPGIVVSDAERDSICSYDSDASSEISDDELRRVHAAQSIYAAIRTEFPILAEQVEMVTSELVSIATLRGEQWMDALYTANQCWMAGDGSRVIEILSPLHSGLLHPRCENDRQFNRLYERELNIAKENWLKWQRTRHQSDMKRAWIYYGQVFARLNQQLREQQTLLLSDVSSQLFNAKNVEVAVPGIFQDRVSGPILCIQSFNPLLHVMGSKRRPKQITVIGSDGSDFKFLLKGQEDLRLDQRVLQVLRLINTLIRSNASDVSSQSAIPPIVTFAVVPLSPSAGLIGWVENAQTLDSIVSEMRGHDSKRIREEATLLQANLYDLGPTLTVMQKTESLELTIQNTQANDIRTMLWLRSLDASEWIERRTIFTRSVAMMSMVGYILGLGDRHPGNILVGSDGAIVHIDFADCFESAMHRDTFPEKVPFRLTKMLVRAMGIGGVTGTFTRTACAGMNVLRKGKHPLMAMLEVPFFITHCF